MLACYSREAVTIQLERCRSSTLRRNVPVGRARGSVTAANLTSTHDSGTSALVRLSLTALSFSVRCYQHHVRMKLLSLSLAERKKERGSYLYEDRKSTRLNSSHLVISYAVFCLKKKKTQQST